ncbi:MAG: hypothetical protein JKY81_06445 [Colwellia sp.]|nr:hypothetical protein [Colwellia sp.]
MIIEDDLIRAKLLLGNKNAKYWPLPTLTAIELGDLAVNNLQKHEELIAI